MRLLPFLGASFIAVSCAQDPKPGFSSQSLTNWQGAEGLWRVKDGQIIGSTVGQTIEANSFLIWTGGEVEDFVLRATVRVEGQNNSGIQYRCERPDPDGFGLVGYQCDVHPAGEYLGMVYEEGTGRGILARRGESVVVAGDGRVVVAGKNGDATRWDVAEWNEYVIVAAGRRVTHFVNGVATADFVDGEGLGRRKGLIGLQLHSGPPMTVFAKDLRLERMSEAQAEAVREGMLRDWGGEFVAQAGVRGRAGAWVLAEGEEQGELSANGVGREVGAEAQGKITQASARELAELRSEPRPEWIWGADDQADAYLRFEWPVPADLATARLLTTCDNEMRVWINGREVLWHDTWEQPVAVDVTEHLLPGAINVIGVHARNHGGPAGWLGRLGMRTEGGEVLGWRSGEAGWLVAPEARDGWLAAGLDGAGWKPVRRLGELGVGPWGLLGAAQVAGAGPVSGSELTVAPGFEAQLLYSVPKDEQGSWVSLATDDAGRLIASDEAGKGLWRVTLGAEPLVEKVPAAVSGAQGLVWANGALMAHVSGRGLVRVSDSDGDDLLGRVEDLGGARGAGEHGNHAVIALPGTDELLVAAGNHADLPEGVARGRWAEDLLLPRQWDANGHAKGRLAPGGWIARVGPDGGDVRLHAWGFRNQYDLAVNRYGDVFTFDADMEWDMGLPWYRPTRICMAVPGADFGWRSGTGKWPSYFEDSLPAVLDIGPGSPTGVVSGVGARMPAEYQDAIFALDWTFGTIYSVHLTPEGAGYRAEAREFVSGVPLPVTDAVIGADGDLYFVTGGRGTQSGLYRVRYVGAASTEAPADTRSPEVIVAQTLRRGLEAYFGVEDPAAVEAAWACLGDGDRYVRHAARIALESQPVEAWADREIPLHRTQARITRAVALARCGDESHQVRQVRRLLAMNPENLSESAFLGLMRAYGLTFLRLGPPTEAQRQQVIAQLGPLLPAASADRNTELIRLLVYLEAPGIVEKVLPLLAEPAAPEVPDWGELVARNRTYGGAIERMLQDPGPTRELGYAFLLRNVRFGWTLAQRRAYFAFLQEAGRYPGGNSYLGFLENIRQDALAHVSQAEREALADIVGEPFAAELGFSVQPPKGPGRAWTLDALVASLQAPGALQERDFAAGRNLFHAAACAACHRFDGLGGAIGPDLTTVRNKFQLAELLESIADPSRAISDQYASSQVTFHDGRTQTGLVIERDGLIEIYLPDPKALPVRARSAEVARVQTVAVSQMPPGLLNALSEEEVRDLVAYLLSGGRAEDPMFGGGGEER